MPLGPSSRRVARYTLGSAASAADRNPRWPLKSVAVKPGLAAFTLIGVSPSSLAYMTVTMVSAALDDGYDTEAPIWASGCDGSLCAVIEPTSLETLTIRAAGERRSSGSIALVTATTPNTLISYTARMSSRSVWLGGYPRRETLAVPALLTRTSKRPNSASTQSAASWMDFWSVISSWTKSAAAPSSRRARSASRPRSASRAPTSTVMSLAPSWRAVSNPIPLLPPVMRAIFVVMPSRYCGGSERGRDQRRLGLAVPPCGVSADGGRWQAVGMVMANRPELAALLRARRARLPPRDAGLPETGTGRRRTPGLRRQEVAQLAGMSIDYYIRLEQGRGPQPSRPGLSALAP